MFKIRSAQNKENIISVSLFAVVVLLAVVNLAVIIPGLVRIYSVQSDVSGKDPIDTATVNEAVRLLNEE
jgi:membrane protein YdbS with pleckstrin-like domain